MTKQVGFSSEGTPPCASPSTGSCRPPATAGTWSASAPPDARRPADLDYLSQVARTAESLGFDAVLTPTGTHCEDARISTAALIRETRRSAGQSRMTALHRGGDRIVEYHRAGFDHSSPTPTRRPVMASAFGRPAHTSMSGQPHLEEAWWFGEGVIPRLRAADLLADPVIPGDTPPWSRQRPSSN
jgi:hypothetical protein